MHKGSLVQYVSLNNVLLVNSLEIKQIKIINLVNALLKEKKNHENMVNTHEILTYHSKEASFRNTTETTQGCG